MINLKKKLSSLVPGDSARSSLQNVLTVDWSGHKTVLVEVPPANPARTNDVELSGIGPSGSGEYGRLLDDEDVQWDGKYAADKDARRPSHPPRKASTASRASRKLSLGRTRTASNATPAPVTDDFARNYAYDTADDDFVSPRLSAALAPGPPRAARASNPFTNPFSHEDDFAAATTGEGGGYARAPAPATGTFGVSGRGGGGHSRAAQNGWVWDADVASPTSTGSAGSGGSSRGTNPFRRRDE